MTFQNKPKFSVVTALLADSEFRRVPQVHTNHKDSLQSSNLNVIAGPKNEDTSISQITLELNFDISFQDSKEVECFIRYVGLFESNDDVSPEELEKYCYINAPAMLFPFVREHLANLCQKAGLGTIMLQSENFVKGYHEMKAKEEKNK